MTESWTKKEARAKQSRTLLIGNIIENHREKVQQQICKCSISKLSKSPNIQTWIIKEASEKQTNGALIGDFHQYNSEWIETKFCRAYSTEHLKFFMIETWTE